MKKLNAVVWRPFAIATALLFLGMFSAGITKSYAKSPAVQEGEAPGYDPLSCGNYLDSCGGPEWTPVNEVMSECCCPVENGLFNCLVGSIMFMNKKGDTCYRRMWTLYEFTPCALKPPGGESSPTRCCTQ